MEFEKAGVPFILLDGQVERTVPSVARVLKAGRVIFSSSEYHPDFKATTERICRDLQLHSIAFDDFSLAHYPFLRSNDDTFRHTG